MRLGTQEEWSVGELLDASDTLVKSMVAKGLQPTVLTINRMLEGLAWGLQLDDALGMALDFMDSYAMHHWGREASTCNRWYINAVMPIYTYSFNFARVLSEQYIYHAH